MSSLLQLAAALAGILEIVIIIRIVISYFPQISPYNPGIRILRSIADPVLAPFRRVLPTMAGIDFSPLLVLLLLSELQSVLNTLAITGISPLHVLVSVVFNLIQNIILFFCVVLVIRVMVQLLQADPFHPLVLVIRQLTNPLLVPFSSLTRNPDIAPVIALSGYLLLYLVVTFLFQGAVDRVA